MSEIKYDTMNIDRWRLEVPTDYDEKKFKKITVFDYQSGKSYDFTFCEKHINKLSLDVFFKMLKQRDV